MHTHLPKPCLKVALSMSGRQWENWTYFHFIVWNMWTQHKLIDFYGSVVRDRKNSGCSKKRESFMCLERRLSFWVSGVDYGVATYFFIQKKEKKNKYKKIYDWIISFHWLSIKEYIFEKLKITWLWIIVTNYQKYMAFCSSYKLSKIKQR